MTVFEFVAAVRGYHVYRNVYQPAQNDVLTCSHEFGNQFDMFAIKTTNSQGVLCGHLPREISRHTKFLLDRGAIVTATLLDTDYRRSPIFQGGLEIRCNVKVELPRTVIAKRLLERYEEMIKVLYKEPESPIIVGSFLEKETIQSPLLRLKSKSAAKTKKKERPSKGIMFYFTNGKGNGKQPPSDTQSQKEEAQTIEVNDSDSD